MIEVLAALSILGGAFFMLVAAVGILRLPDFYTRMHAITKAGTLGVGLILLGISLHFAHLSAITRAAAVFTFVLLTAPVSAHMIGRAGYLDHVPLWKGTLVDQLRQQYEEVLGGQSASSASVAPDREQPPTS